MNTDAAEETEKAAEIAEEDGSPYSGIGPRWLPTLVLVLAGIVTLVGTFSTWAKAQALDTDEWENLSTELLEQPEVQEALATYLVDELYNTVDVSSEIEDRLPEDLKGLAGPVSGLLRQPATDGVERLLADDVTIDIWAKVNREAHATMVAILRDETGEFTSTADGKVTLDLGELVRAVGQNLGLSEDLLDRIPEDAGQVVIFESDELADVQNAVAVLDFLSWFVLVLVFILFALSVYVARGARVAAFRRVGLSLVVIGVIVLAARAIAVRILVDTIVDSPTGRDVAEVVALVTTALLRRIAWTEIIYGVIILVFAALLGERSWAVATRRALAPALNASVAAFTTGMGLFVLLIIWWSPGRAMNSWIAALMLLGLVVAGGLVLRARTMTEFPDTTMSDVTDSVRRRFQRESESAK